MYLSMRKKLVDVLFVLLTVLFFLGAAYFIADNFFRTSTVLGLNGESFVALNRQSVKARVTDPSKNSSLYYKFTENQRAHLENLMHRQGAAALRAVIELPQRKKSDVGAHPFEFGFSYAAKDGSGSIAPGRAMVTGDLSELDSKDGAVTFAVSICIVPGGEVPSGFFVHGTRPYVLRSVQFTEPLVGWDKSGDVPLYALGPDGGGLHGDYLMGAEKVFGSPPELVLILEQLEEPGTWRNQPRVTFSYGKDTIAVRRTMRQPEVRIQTAGLSASYAKFVPGENASHIRGIMLRRSPPVSTLESGAVVTPYVTDLGLIMTWPRKNWRYKDYELYEWEEVPHVLFFDFASYKVQNQYLTRLAYFVEKAGYKGTLVSDDFVENRHGYNAHDYKAGDLAAFFTTAARQNFRLNAREQDLCGILLANGVILRGEESGTYLPGEGAIVSFSRESPDYLRWEFLAHESWHGIFFTNPEFRAEVSRIYDAFDSKCMEFLQTYWETYPSLGYDRRDDYLMRNEFMAYLMQQNIRSVQEYFLAKAGWQQLNARHPDLTDYVRQTNARAFLKAAEELNDWAFRHYGFAAGRVSLVSLQNP